jgi:hypothetical protein
MAVESHLLPTPPTQLDNADKKPDPTKKNVLLDAVNALLSLIELGDTASDVKRKLMEMTPLDK